MLIATYICWRVTQRAAPVGDDSAYLTVLPNSSAVAVYAAYEWYEEEVSESGEGEGCEIITTL
ncbi:hypothetical protein [Notoacmeibacter marinus]|uniref:hypothetical protein n=1 Tax=Notoacmeibacter marinus TaxID=1876515 RepID=UPI000DF3B3C0|nr:hypothetical protein [Notoacmeibacter marinus]